MNFREQDIEFLDKILEWKLKKHESNPAYGYTDEAIMKELGIEYEYYYYLIKIIADYSEFIQKIVHVERGNISILIDPLKIITEDFINSGGFKNVLRKIKDSERKSRKKERRENLKLQTEIFKNTIWIAAFIISLIINLLYVFGIFNYSFIKPRPEIIEIKESLFKENLRQVNQDSLVSYKDSVDFN